MRSIVTSALPLRECDLGPLVCRILEHAPPVRVLRVPALQRRYARLERRNLRLQLGVLCGVPLDRGDAVIVDRLVHRPQQRLFAAHVGEVAKVGVTWPQFGRRDAVGMVAAHEVSALAHAPLAVRVFAGG